MKNFLYKEIRLCLYPYNYLFLGFALMQLVPDYPRYCGFYFICLSVFRIFATSELNKDIQYSMILPITKRDIVKSRCILICAYELISVILSIPFAILFSKIIPSGNKAGIDGDVAFFGLNFILLTIFHFTFFNLYYKKAEKPGFPFLMASLLFWIFYFIFEFPFWIKDIAGIEYFQILDKVDSESLIKQLPILFCGILIYILGWILTYKTSSKKFEKVDL